MSAAPSGRRREARGPPEGRALRFLMVCMQFPTGPGQSYMTTELARALVAAGHEVEALVLDWSAEPGGAAERRAGPGGVPVLRCAPRAIQGWGPLVRSASKFVLSGLHAARAARRELQMDRFDAVIAWAPACAVAPVLALARRAGIERRILFIWDFFPDHHREIGRIPSGPAYWIARAWEQRLLGQFSAVVCTLPGNVDYLRRNWRLRPGQKVMSTPIWSETAPRPPVDRAAVRSRHGLPPEDPIAVFGGQLVEGRGFEQMLGAAAAGRRSGSRLQYLFVGEGRLASMLDAQAEGASNVRRLPGLPREDYLELVGACDVGMVATVPGVSSFSIPTKTVDYLRAGLPVVAAVEPGSDFVSLLRRYGVGRAVAFGDAAGFHRQAERLALDPRLRAAALKSAPRCLDEVFDVRHAVRTVLRAAEG